MGFDLIGGNEKYSIGSTFIGVVMAIVALSLAILIWLILLVSVTHLFFKFAYSLMGLLISYDFGINFLLLFTLVHILGICYRTLNAYQL